MPRPSFHLIVEDTEAQRREWTCSWDQINTKAHFQLPPTTKFWIETHQVLWSKDSYLLDRGHFSVQSVLRRHVSCCYPPSSGLPTAFKRPFNYSVASPAHTRVRGKMYMLPAGSRTFWKFGSVWTRNGENRWGAETIKQEKMLWGHDMVMRAVNGPLRTRGEALCENHSQDREQNDGAWQQQEWPRESWG